VTADGDPKVEEEQVDAAAAESDGDGLSKAHVDALTAESQTRSSNHP